MKKINFIVFLFMGLVFVSCDKDFDELNKNPNDPTAVPSELLLGSMIRTTGNVMYSTFNGGDMGSCWAQHFAKVQYNDEERYLPRESAIGNVWATLYESTAADANAMYNLAVEEENLVSQGAALTMKAYAFLLLTDLYGDVPFSEALQGATNISPVYDSQQAVYNGSIALLDEAISKLNPANGSLDSSQDIMYGGDVSKWRKFAASLKFRALMRISGKDLRASEMQALVNSGLLFSSSDDDANLVYLSDAPNANPIYESVVFGTRNEWKVNSAIVDRMDGTVGGLPNDARLPVIAQPNGDGDYRGKPSGYNDVPSNDYNYANVSPLGEFYLRPELPAVFLSYTELQFLLAEAAFEGYISGGNGAAAAYYQSGIEASFAENDGADVTGYYTGSVIFTPGFAREQIATQKWLALYSQGFEAWTEWRRTGYPVLTPAIDGAISQIPSRYTYPVIEASLNAANYNAAVGNLSGGDKLTSPVWWMN
ncbi:SusD/RagB family nutrient-binding outer membrane lipoprotein [Xanthomarina sp. F2636L]|uniref:SusD/RagB family nutrient-binding outer membrane lipoprotein n=1 Tax=Xanthomarina sp. F2636L TaxID=2996018 RepID=UPI00225E5DF1|nr:SusD/RagB family nutrient-binding outer membrane lipoprotein [Xanthomarina sp. F2636L]MCX7550719.1 SusD/RagB family nutrient-binding outer membrane lipoprotein [Xanthomarina sp. F2636L]